MLSAAEFWKEEEFTETETEGWHCKEGMREQSSEVGDEQSRLGWGTEGILTGD